MKISKRTIMVWLCVAAVYFSAGEAFRAYARAELEKDLRANFEKLLCPAGRIDGDICLDFPDEGRCVSREYIDYRTAWGHFAVARDIEGIVVAAARTHDTPHKLANWFACQGIKTSVRDYRERDDFPDKVARNPSVAALSVRVTGLGPKYGFLPAQRTFPIYPLEWLLGSEAMFVRAYYGIDLNLTGVGHEYPPTRLF